MKQPKKHTIQSLKERTTDDAGCWIWNGYHANKVPSVFHNGTMVPVRRLFLDLLDRKPTRKTFIHPTCEHGSCVNPEHYKIYTERQHMAVILKKSHQSPTRSANVQKYKRAHNAKINEEIAQEIRMSEESGPVLAKKYNVNRSIISRIRRNVSWVNKNHPFLSLMR